MHTRIQGIVLASLALCATSVAAPRRIISTAPSITETLFALGAGDRVVGVTTYCRYPAAAQKITKIGTWVQPNVEAIVSAKPDLIILQKTSVMSRSALDRLGVPIVEVKFDSIADILQSTDAIGDAIGLQQRARELHQSIQRDLALVRTQVSSLPPTPVLFLVGRTPGTLEALIAAGPRTYINEAIEAAGGRNIFATSAMSYAKIAAEEIVARNPSVIIDATHAAENPYISDAERRAQIALWKRFHTVAAVRNGRVFPVGSEIFLVPGPRVTDLVHELARLLHPGASK